jgi:coenzyme F420-reducing hydrogenase alpha subunit
MNVRVGGFYRVPQKTELQPLAESLKVARDLAKATVDWTAGFSFPDFERDYEFVSMRHPDEYPMNEGRLVSNKGLDISILEFEKYFTEEHIRHSNALRGAKQDGGIYLVGPLARYSLNFDRFPQSVQDAARSAGLSNACLNPFKSIVVRAVETLYACEEALHLIETYEEPERPSIEIEAKKGTGYGCTEAPRGMLYHSYEIDEDGIIRRARIVPPTSQNQKMIEMDLRHFIPSRLNLPEETLTLQCEQAIRNYDPCISCATHFLKLEIEQC